jgi:hypothetical protein
MGLRGGNKQQETHVFCSRIIWLIPLSYYRTFLTSLVSVYLGAESKENMVYGTLQYAGVDYNLTSCPLQNRLQHIYYGQH